MKDNLDDVRKSIKLKHKQFESYLRQFLKLLEIPYSDDNKDIMLSLIINGVLLHELNIQENKIILMKAINRMKNKEKIMKQIKIKKDED